MFQGEARKDHFGNDLDGSLPAVELGRVEFAQMQDGSLKDAPPAHADAFSQRVIDMILAVLFTTMSFEKHARIFGVPGMPCLGGKSSHNPFQNHEITHPWVAVRKLSRNNRKIVVPSGNLQKSG